MSWSEMCTWNDDTPAIVPAGARISAGKFGIVARSLPNTALTSVKRSPVSCMPSPESPANRMTTSSRRLGLERLWSRVSRSRVPHLVVWAHVRIRMSMCRFEVRTDGDSRLSPMDGSAASVPSRTASRNHSSASSAARALPERGVDATAVAGAADQLGLDVDPGSDAAGRW